MIQIARALGGKVRAATRYRSRRRATRAGTRGTSIKFDATAPGGFIVNSFNGGDQIEIKDMVRRALGMPEWEPGDGQDRRIRPDRVKAWDRAVVDREADETFIWTQEQRQQIDRAETIWQEAADPRGTLAEGIFENIVVSILPTISPATFCGSIRDVHGETRTRARRSSSRPDRGVSIVDDGSIHGGTSHRLAARRRKIDRRMRGVATSRRGEDRRSGRRRTRHRRRDRDLRGRAGAARLSAAWACGSKGLVARFPVIPGVNHLILLGERDTSSGTQCELWAGAG